MNNWSIVRSVILDPVLTKIKLDQLNSLVLFVNEASSSIGMGHILRSLVVARAMSMRGYRVSGITIGDEKAVMYADMRAQREQFEWPIELVQDAQAAIRHIIKSFPLVVVVDCFKESAAMVQACAESGVPVVVLDYFLVEQPMPQAIINLIDHNPAALSGGSPDRGGVAYYEGPAYAIIRDEFLLARSSREKRGEYESVTNILIAFGGADPSGNSRRALDMLAQRSGNYVVDLIVGPLFAAETKSINDFLRHNCSVNIHVSPDYMGQLFEGADLVFCGGGGTLLEALCVGVPSIVMPQNELERRHAASLEARGACWLSEHVDWESVVSLESREKLSECARNSVDGLGAAKICDVIEYQSRKPGINRQVRD